ncbi:transcriptional regulator [bacterium]|nr:MAG: transcriptional regulator [bacterium]
MAATEILEQTLPMGLGAQIRSLRESRRFGLSEAARRANVAKSTLSDWEHGRKVPSGAALERILDALEVDGRQRARMLADSNPGYARWALEDSELGPPVHMGRMLRSLRLRQGWTQAEVAAKTGVTQSAVAKWESGDSRLEGTALHNACFALGASPRECAVLAVAPEPFGSGDEPFDFEARYAEIDALPPRLRPVLRLGLEADLWKLAARDPVWDGPLCTVMAQRVYDTRLMCRYDEIEGEAKGVLRLAKSGGFWAEATPAFMALANLWKHQGMALAKRTARLERWADRLPRNLYRLWPLGGIAENRATLGDEKGGMEMVLRIRGDLGEHGSTDDFHDRQAIAGVRLAAGNAKATLELLEGDDHISMVTMRTEAMILLGQEPRPEWMDQIRRQATMGGMPYNLERLRLIETNLKRMRRGIPVVRY